MKKEEILAKALEFFANQGYFGTSMEEIAKAVGIRKASLYSHYSGKESIFTAVFNNILEEYTRFIRELTAFDESTNIPEKLVNIFTAYIKNCRNNKKQEFWDRYYYYPPAALQDYIFTQTYQVEMDFIQQITALMDQGIKNGTIKQKNPRDLALSFYYMMIGFAMGVKFYQEKAIEEDITKCITVFLDGIKP